MSASILIVSAEIVSPTHSVMDSMSTVVRSFIGGFEKIKQI
jgi:hypothetical protein